ncbi:GMC oxidoreductase [Salipaludibacillus sp. CF4.18]|uniref:GMC oxidoreductase n=1 Tax=Salipaludibacillus sp. CF4.18 TaxID=3373081 RepID=UPI003EE7C620
MRISQGTNNKAKQSNAEYISIPWLPLTSLEEMERIEYDVLIVGSGIGGGSVTWRLCNQWGINEKKIGVIEKGNFLIPTQAANLPTMNSARMQAYFDNVSYPLGRMLPEFRGARQVFAFGGRTLFWNAVSPRLNPYEIADWPVSFEEMEAYYLIAERVMNVTQMFSEDSSMTKVFLNELQRRGLVEATQIPIAADIRSALSKKHSMKGYEVFFGSISFFAQALNHRPFDLAINARAVQVVVDQGEIKGIVVMSPNKKSYFIQAKTVVLSASTFETPRLLLHSGIEGRAIGHYLMNQSYVTATGTIRREQFPGLLGTLGILIPSIKDRPYQIQMRGPSGFFWNQPYQEKPYLEEPGVDFLCFGEVEPRYDNKVTLDPFRKDEYGVPEIQVEFSFSERDQQIIRKMAEAVEHISAYLGINIMRNDGQSSICLMPPGDLNHDSGTCRMGDDPATSVVNRFGQVHGITGLFVADQSVFPSIGAPNLGLSTAALAIRTADYILRQGR